MSISVHLESLSNDLIEKINDDLTIPLETKKPFSKGFAKSFTKSFTKKSIEAYEISDRDFLHLPFAYAVNELSLSRPKSTNFKKISDECTFEGILRDEQKNIKDEAIENLNTFGTCLISAYPGFGKTCTSIYITSKIKLKTLIVLNRLVLMQQWEEAIKKFCPKASVHCLKPGKKFPDVDPDYVIINAINVSKFGRDFYKDFGTVIVDEAHLIMSQVLSQSLFYLCPRYLIGLSATPYRPDGMDRLMSLFFSEHKIIRTLKRTHKVFRVDTGFTPEVEFDRNGKVIWGFILEQQCSNRERNDLIVKIIQDHPDRIFLVLSKRIEQAQHLHDRLKEKGESVALLIGSSTTFEKEARILIGTSSKIGVGFDHARMNALVLASDLEQYFIQYLGRVFRTEEVEPIVFDLVDNNSILKKHYSTRKRVYEESGGYIEKYIK